MPTTTWVTPMAAALTAAGVASSDADCLAQSYPLATPAEFVTGLDWLAQAYVALAAPNLALPLEAPWAQIASAVAGVPAGDIEDAFQTAIATEPPELQSALLNAVMSRAQLLQAQQAQQVARKKKASSAQYLRALTDLGYEFRLNVLNDTVEVKVAGAYQPISDPLAAKVRRQMRDKGFEYVNVMEDVYIAEAYDQRYHPVLEYLKTLQYDGGDHIARLASYFVDKDGVFPTFLRRWLIGAVMRAYEAEQNRVLVLDGRQKLGKSKFVEWLASVLPGCHVEGPIDPDDKDCSVRLASKWIWEVSEFGSTTRRSDRDALKFWLTQKTVTVRKAYGRFDMIKPALASFVGTFNDQGGVLNDPTGNRRFMIANLTAINWAYKTDFDPNAIWAEAHAAYLAGETWNLTQDEERLADKVNERYEIDDPIEGIMKRFFRLNPANVFAWTATDEILTMLEANGLRGGSTRQNAMALASVMTRLGMERSKRTNRTGQKVWGYAGVESI